MRSQDVVLPYLESALSTNFFASTCFKFKLPERFCVDGCAKSQGAMYDLTSMDTNAAHREHTNHSLLKPLKPLVVTLHQRTSCKPPSMGLEQRARCCFTAP